MKENPSARQALQKAYQAATPYPPVRAAEPNPQYACAILDNMAGQISEMSTIGLYLYDNLLASGYTEAAETFLGIAMVEMRHLNLFSRLSVALGENPRLWHRQKPGGRYTYWSPARLSYPPIQPPAGGERLSHAQIRILIAQAIRGEEKAVTKYMAQTTWIQDNSVCALLKRIAADEQMHTQILTQLYHRF